METNHPSAVSVCYQQLGRKQAGFTLGEMMIVVGIIGMLLALAYAIYSTVLNRVDDSAEVQNARNLLTSASTLRMTDGRYPTNFHQDLLRVDGYPTNMELTSSGVRNSWGGEVTVVRGSNPRHLQLRYPKASESGCYQLVTSVIRSRNMSVSVGNNSAKTDNADDLANLASQHCADGVTVMWEGRP